MRDHFRGNPRPESVHRRHRSRVCGPAPGRGPGPSFPGSGFRRQARPGSRTGVRHRQHPGGVARGPGRRIPALHGRSGRTVRLQALHRGRAHADRRIQGPGPHPPGQGFDPARPPHHPRLGCGLRVHGLSRTDRRYLPASARTGLGPDRRQGLFRRLLAGAHQSRGQGPHLAHGGQDRVRPDPGRDRPARLGLRRRGLGRRAPGFVHQGGRSGQGY